MACVSCQNNAFRALLLFFPGDRKPILAVANETMTHTRRLPRVIAALQFPSFRGIPLPPMSWYEDYLMANAAIFIDGGIQAVKIQDETRETGAAAARTIARMAALGRLFRKAYPDVALGIIVQAHDAVAPLAIADAADADFVRLKVFVGAAINAEGVRNALSVEATAYRAAIGRPDIAILADVHDRTSHPLAAVPRETAALWAKSMGADALVITGSNFSDSLDRIAAARDAGVRGPLFIGGSVDAGNVAQALTVAHGVIVSSSLRLKDAAETDLLRWDRTAVHRLIAAAKVN
jgi:predicted TIM-barrel enzyme